MLARDDFERDVEPLGISMGELRQFAGVHLYLQKVKATLRGNMLVVNKKSGPEMNEEMATILKNLDKMTKKELADKVRVMNKIFTSINRALDTDYVLLPVEIPTQSKPGALDINSISLP